MRDAAVAAVSAVFVALVIVPGSDKCVGVSRLLLCSRSLGLDRRMTHARAKHPSFLLFPQRLCRQGADPPLGHPHGHREHHRQHFPPGMFHAATPWASCQSVSRDVTRCLRQLISTGELSLPLSLSPPQQRPCSKAIYYGPVTALLPGWALTFSLMEFSMNAALLGTARMASALVVGLLLGGWALQCSLVVAISAFAPPPYKSSKHAHTRHRLRDPNRARRGVRLPVHGIASGAAGLGHLLHVRDGGRYTAKIKVDLLKT